MTYELNPEKMEPLNPNSEENKLYVVKAVPQDASDVLRITKEAFSKYVREANIKTPLDAVNETYENVVEDIYSKKVFLAKIGEIPVGSIRVHFISETEAYISRFGVLCNYHSRGVGKMLIYTALSYLQKTPAKTVSLHTAANYSELVSFYTHNGFVVKEISFDKGYPRALMVNTNLSAKRQ